jgi:pSer/pThr/pTyr-binding forkhead associated (FHA) protein
MSDFEWQEEPTRVSTPGPEQGAEATIRMGGGVPSEARPVLNSETVVIGEPPPSFAWLAVRDGPRAGRIFTLNPKGTTIGRDTQCDIILDNESVSRQHAKVKAAKGKKERQQYSIWDLASANGTFVNNKQVVKKALKDGDEIKIGRTTLVFKQL